MGNKKTKGILDSQMDEAIKILEEHGQGLYGYWMENFAQSYIDNWLKENIYDVKKWSDEEYVAKYVHDLTQAFIDWICKGD